MTAPVTPKPGGSGWGADATRFAHQAGKLFSYLCPPNGTENAVWGTTTYTDDSSVCTAAVNHGLITFESGGTVTIEMRAGLASYTGSNRNGTTTESSGHSTGSFVFIWPTHLQHRRRLRWPRPGRLSQQLPRQERAALPLHLPPQGQPRRDLWHRHRHHRQPRLHCRSPRRADHARRRRLRHDRDQARHRHLHRLYQNGITSLSGSWSYGSYIFVTTDDRPCTPLTRSLGARTGTNAPTTAASDSSG